MKPSQDKLVEKTYYPLVDIARFFAAFSVLAFHYFSVTAASTYAPLRFYLERGYLGVQLFFIISGFVIFFSLQDNIKRFALSRFLRIYPIFWVLCTVTYITTILIPAEGVLSFGRYLYNLLIINNGTTALMVDGSYWTLTHELIFYVAIGLFVFLFKKKRVEWFFMLWLLILSLGVVFRLQEMFIFKILLIRSGFYFIFGGILGLLVQEWRQSTLKVKLRRIGSMVLSVVMVGYLSSVLLEKDPSLVTNHFGMYDVSTLWSVIGLFFLVPVLVYLSYKVSHPKMISISKALGGITYPLYLLHNKIGALVLGAFGVFGIWSPTSVLFVIGLIILCHYIAQIEERWRKQVNRKIVTTYNL